MTFSFLTRRVLVMLYLGLLALFITPQALEAQVVNPTAESVTEDSLMQALTGDGAVTGRVSIPDGLSTGLIKPGNKDWAATLYGPVRLVTIVSFFGMIALLALFYMIRGKIRIDAGPSTEKIARFSGFERFAHWLMAVSFIVLAITGLNLIFGRSVILPLFGEAVFGTLSAWGKVGHNYMGFAFMLGLVFAFVSWIAHNIPNKLDLVWIKQGGGLLAKGVHPPAKKFNAGQKLIFWSVIVGGVALSFTGVMLLFPGLYGGEAEWQLYQVIHGIVAALLTAIVIAHIYIGSVGMEGAFDAMGSGEVDLNWAKEHHSLWVDEVQASAPKSATDNPKAHPAE